MKKFCNYFLGLFLVINLFSVQPAYSYIDPATGSMMFSVILGIITTLFFLVYSFLLKFKLLLSKKDTLTKNNIPFVIYSEGKQYFNIFRQVIDEFERREIPLMFYTSSKDDPFFQNEYKFVKGEFIGEEWNAFAKLAFLKADVCLMTTPGLDVYQLKRSKFTKYYCHIFHAVASSLLYKLFSLDYYDAVLCDGEFQIPLIRELEKKRNMPEKELPVVGCSYMDYLSEKAKSVSQEHEKFTVLIAPSWGKNSILNNDAINLIDSLLKTDWQIVIRPHPQSVKYEKNMLRKLEERYKNCKNLIWNYDTENLTVMAKSDVLISDFSGIRFEYAFLFNKPFLYFNNNFNIEIYDCNDIEEELWRFKVEKIIGKELTKDSTKDVVEIIKNIHSNPEILQQIKDASDVAWQHKGKAAKNIVDYLIRKQKEISKC